MLAQSFLLMDLRAYSLPSDFATTWWTLPKEPSPITPRNSKSSTVSFFSVSWSDVISVVFEDVQAVSRDLSVNSVSFRSVSSFWTLKFFPSGHPTKVLFFALFALQEPIAGEASRSESHCRTEWALTLVLTKLSLSPCDSSKGDPLSAYWKTLFFLSEKVMREDRVFSPISEFVREESEAEECFREGEPTTVRSANLNSKSKLLLWNF